MEIPDYYKMLQVQSDADLEVIQAAYRRLSRKYQPDTSDLPNADEEMVLLDEAYEVLSNLDKRTEYDRKRNLYQQQAVSPPASSQEPTDFEPDQGLQSNEQPDISDWQPNMSTSIEETKSLGVGWRVIAGIVAIIVIGILIYPLVQGNRTNEDRLQATVPPEVQAVVDGPQATAQANPDSAESQFKLGNAYYEAGQWELAIASYQKAKELDPSYQAAYANLGATYYQQQQFDLAVTQYEKALELDPEDGESAYNLGAIYLQQALSQAEQPDPQLLDQAIIQIEKALEISPGLAEPHFSLGVAYLALNQRAESIQAFEAFLSLDTSQDSQARQEAERYLKILRGQ